MQQILGDLGSVEAKQACGFSAEQSLNIDCHGNAS
jgi:hypothetical protein